MYITCTILMEFLKRHAEVAHQLMLLSEILRTDFGASAPRDPDLIYREILAKVTGHTPEPGQHIQHTTPAEFIKFSEAIMAHWLATLRAHGAKVEHAQKSQASRHN